MVVGILLLAWSAWRAGWRLQLDRREILLAAGTGVGIILVGQGTASWSAPHLDPGVVAVLTSTMPLWAALIGWLLFGTRIAVLGTCGLAAGFAGVVFLAWPGSGGVAVGPALLVVAGATGWAAAVVIASRSGILRRPALVTALQALVGGGLQVVVGLLTGEAGQLEPHRLLAVMPEFAYLVAVPSIVGLCCSLGCCRRCLCTSPTPRSTSRR